MEVNSHTHLDLTMSTDGKWDNHVNNIIAKKNYKTTVKRKFKYILDRQSPERIYLSYIRPSMEYANILLAQLYPGTK